MIIPQAVPDETGEVFLDVLFRDVHPARQGREIPIATLYQRLGLKPYDRYATFMERSFTPGAVTIPLDSHIGTPAKALVSVGDRVKRGQLIGDVSEDQLGCAVHASIDGIVTVADTKVIKLSAKK